MGAPCALCKSKKPHRTHVFPQNSRAEVQVKWVKALGLPQEKEDAVLAEMRQLEQKGNRPRWCAFHFEYDSAGIHFPKYFDPEEGKTAQGYEEEEEEEEEEEKQGTSKEEKADTPRDRSSTPTEPRRSTRRKAAPAAAAAVSPSPSTSEDKPHVLDVSIQKLLLDAGLSVPGIQTVSSPKPSTSAKRAERGGKGGEKATAVEKTLQDILMGAGLPVPETLQAKTGLLVDEGSDGGASPARRTRHIGAVAHAMKKGAITVGEAKRLGTFVPGAARPGGSTLSSPKTLMNPMATKFAGDWPKVIIPKPKMPSYCYNHNTMEKYDDTDALRNFKMPCKTAECRSELTVIMNRARALEDQFDDLSNNVLQLVQMYKTKTPQAFRPPQSLATVQGRAAAVAGPVYGIDLPYNQRQELVPIDSLSVQERRIKRMGVGQKEPERLLTDDDLASTVRRRVAKQDQSSAEEEEEDAPELEDDDSAADDDYRPSSSKRRRLASARDADTSASEASPPMLEMIE